MPERRRRLVELARLGGISEQQVRNYLADGLLPPARRTAGNYRIFTEQHADALRTVRALAAGHGWARTREILTAVHGGDLVTALAAIDAGHAELTAERAAIAAAAHAFTVAAGDPAPGGRTRVRIGELATATGVRTPVLRLWERRGLLRPGRDAAGHRVYDPAEQRIAHLVAVLRTGRFSFPVIEAAITTIRTTGSLTRARAELARRDRQLHQLSRARLRASAALDAYLDRYHS